MRCEGSDTSGTTNAANPCQEAALQIRVRAGPEGPNHFVDTVAGAVREATAAQVTDRADVEIVYVNAADPHAVVKRPEVAGFWERLTGVALMVPETPQVRDADCAHQKCGRLCRCFCCRFAEFEV